MTTEAFVPLELAGSVLADLGEDEYPTLVSGWGAAGLELGDAGTHFGYVWEAGCSLACASGAFELKAGMYFAVPGAASVSGPGRGLVVTRLGYRGVFSIGGPIEAEGRLRYIDGCTDSLLVAPARLGDPCLNALYFPPRTDQTRHTHPSIRVGLIVSGRGECVTPGRRYPLEPGQAFLIPAGAAHSFATSERPMVVIAYHPDSDYGPTDEAHPMINRTIIVRGQ